MAEDKGRGRQSDDHGGHRQAERHAVQSQHDHASVVAVQEKPASGESSFGEARLSGSLLGSSVLNGRGNAPVKIALMQQTQQTQSGNRSMQRYLQRMSAQAASNSTPNVQRCGATPCGSSSEEQAVKDTAELPVQAYRESTATVAVERLATSEIATESAAKIASNVQGPASPVAPTSAKVSGKLGDGLAISKKSSFGGLAGLRRSGKAVAGTMLGKGFNKLPSVGRHHLMRRRVQRVSLARTSSVALVGNATNTRIIQRCGPTPCNCSPEKKAAALQMMSELRVMRSRSLGSVATRGPPVENAPESAQLDGHTSRSHRNDRHYSDLNRLLSVTRLLDVTSGRRSESTTATLQRISEMVGPTSKTKPGSPFGSLGKMAARLQRFVATPTTASSPSNSLSITNNAQGRTPVQRFDIPNPLDIAKKLAEKALGVIKDLASSAYNTAQSLGESAINGVANAGSSAWNTIKGVGSSVVSTATNLATSAWNTAKSLGKGAWDTVKGIGTQVWNTAKEAGSKAWSTAKDLGGKAWNFAKSAGSKAWSTAKGLGTAAWNGAKDLGSKAWNGAKNFAGKAWTGVKSFGGKVWDTVKSVAGKAWDAAKSLGGKAVDVAKSVAEKLSPKDLCKTAGNLLASVYKKVSPYVKKAWEGAKKLGSAAWSKAKALGGKLWDTAKDWGSKAATYAKGIIKDITGAVKDKASKAWNGAKKLGSEVLTGAKNFAGKAWDTAKSLGTSAWNTAKSAATGLYDRAKSLGTSAWNTAKEMGSKAWDTARSLGSKIGEQAKGAATQLLGIADKLTGGAASKVTGLAQKIMDKASGLLSSVLSIARGLADKAINAAKSFVAKAMSKAKELGSKALSTAKEFADSAWNKAKELGGKAIEEGKQWASKAWNDAKQWGSKAIADAKQWASKAWTEAKQWGSKALATAKEWGGKAWNIAKDLGGKAWDTVKGWGGKVWSVAKDVGGKVSSFAKMMGSKASDFAKKIGLDKAWNTAKDLGGKAYKIVKDAVAKIDLKKAALGLAAILGVPMPMMGGLAALKVLMSIGRSQCVMAMAPAVAGPIGNVEKNFPMLQGVFKVMENPNTIVEATKNAVGGMIAKIGPEARSHVTSIASKFGQRIQKHLKGILFYLEAGVVDLGKTWWDQIKKMGRSLLFPWEGMGGELKSMGSDIVGAVKSFWSLDFSGGIDHILSMLRTLNGVLGNWYGWFTIASVLIGGIIGAFFGGAGAIPGMGAGLAFAGEVGEGLLVALVATETASIGKAGFDLARGTQTEAQDQDDEKQIATSAITLGITGALVLLSGIAARFAKAVFGRLVGLFKDMKGPKVEVKLGDVKPGDAKPGDAKPGEVNPKEHTSTSDGKHETFSDEEGIKICSDNCSLMSKRYADVLKDNATLKEKLAKVEQMPEGTPKELEAKRAAEDKIYQELEGARQAQVDTILGEIDEKFRDQIDNAKTPAEADNIRYQRYLEKAKAKGIDPPMDRTQWNEAVERIRENQARGSANENAALKAAGVDNNNLATDTQGNARKPVEFQTKDGVRRPDGITDKKIIDVKSIEDGTIFNTEQLQAFKEAGAKGLPDGTPRELAVIISGTDAVLADGTPKVRPSGPLAADATVLHRNPSTGKWMEWDPQLRDGQGGWRQITKARATEILGGSVP